MERGYGVWDRGSQKWFSTDLLEGEAKAVAEEENKSNRIFEPAEQVLILIEGHWWPGRIDRWVLEHDGWYGRATLERTGAVNWYPAIALRRPDPEADEDATNL